MNSNSGSSRPGPRRWVWLVSVVALTTAVSGFVMIGRADGAVAVAEDSGASSTLVLAPVFLVSAMVLCAAAWVRGGARRTTNSGVVAADEIDVVHLDPEAVA
ncbi:hypothetical protein BH09ACT11_BH09ACT11_15410 [soil metagenome]